MRPIRGFRRILLKRLLGGAMLAIALLAAGVANAATSKLDARVRAAIAQVRGGMAIPEAMSSGIAVNAAGELDVFIRGSVSRGQLEALGIKVRSELPGLFTAYVPLDAVAFLEAMPSVQTVRGAVQAEPNLNASIPAISANFARGAGPTFAGANGAGVLVCDVDTGIDYDHGDFKDAAGNVRLVNIWDQANSLGPNPSGFAYGTEWSQAQLNATANLETDTNGHGSHVLGIIGGDGSQTGGIVPAHTYAGVAPMADLMMVKTTFATTAIVDGVTYAMNRATALGKNIAVNLSLGSQFGPHDGTSDFESGLNALTGAGRIIVVSAGNDRGTNWHAKLFATAQDSAKMLISGIAATPAAGNPNVAIDGYYKAGDNFSITLRAPNGTLIGPIPIGTINAAYPGTTIAGVGRVYIENGAFVTATGDKEIYFELSRTAATSTPNGTWTFIFNPVAAPSGGRIDMWRYYNAVSSTASTFTLKNTNDNLVSEPGNASEVITVAAWATKASWVDCGNRNVSYSVPPTLGAIASFSSPGPTRDGRQKPDITAPGFGVGSTRSFDVAGLACGTGASALLNDGANHIINQGTSMAAPHVTGTAALLMQKFGAMTPAQIKSYLFSHATIDGFTGSVWNQDYGNGKLNVGDLAPPVVTVQSPNGGELLTECTNATLTWNATDTQTGVTSVDLELSRTGSSGPFETIANGIGNTGSYVWTVSGPLTSDGFVRVTAHDGATNVASDLSNAAFSIVSPVITASAGAGGAISPSGSITVACGSDQSFSITPASCFHVSDVRVDGASVGAVTAYTFSSVQGNHTIAASFAADLYTITASAGAGGSIAPSGAVSVSCGADQSFTIAADACSSIGDVLVDGVSVGAVSAYTFTNVTADHTISASFVASTRTITASAGTGGTISPNGAVSVVCGASQAFGIAADACYAIGDVVVDGSSVGAVSSYTFTDVQADHTISASFVALSYTITASAGAGGSLSPNGPVSVACGADQSFTIAADACYDIADVLVDGVSVGAVSTHTFTNVQADHTIAASFSLKSYTIAASAGAGGSIAPSGSVPVACGASQAFTITPDAGYHVLDVRVDGGSVGAVESYTFSDVQADHTIAASFEINSYTVTVTVVGNGTVTRDPDLPSYPGGSTVTLTATPDPDWAFAGWSGDATGTTNPLALVVGHDLQITATFVDAVPPTAQLLSPNGGERLVVGAVRTVDWTATDNIGVTGIDLYVSRDNGATYTELVASGLENTGSYDWVVTGPGTDDADDVMTNFLKVVAHDGVNTGSDVGDAGFEIINLSAAVGAALPLDFALQPVSPNPAHGPASIQYAVPREARVRLRVVDVLGREVVRLVDGVVPAGRYQVKWNGASSDGRVRSGVYFVRLESGSRVFTRRLAMTR